MRTSLVALVLLTGGSALAEEGTRTLAVAPLNVLGRDAPQEGHFDQLLHSELDRLGIASIPAETSRAAWARLGDAPMSDDATLGRFAREAGAARALSILLVTRPEKWAVTAKIVRNDGFVERLIADLEFARPSQGSLDPAVRSALASTLEELKLDSLELYPLVSSAPPPPPTAAPGASAPRPSPVIAYALLGGSAVGVGLGALFAYQSSRTWAEFNAVGGGEPPEESEVPTLRELKARAQLQSTLSALGFVAGAAAAGVGGFLLVTQPQSPQPAISLGLVPSGVRVSGSFP